MRKSVKPPPNDDPHHSSPKLVKPQFIETSTPNQQNKPNIQLSSLPFRPSYRPIFQTLLSKKRLKKTQKFKQDNNKTKSKHRVTDFLAIATQKRDPILLPKQLSVDINDPLVDAQFLDSQGDSEVQQKVSTNNQEINDKSITEIEENQTEIPKHIPRPHFFPSPPFPLSPIPDLKKRRTKRTSDSFSDSFENSQVLLYQPIITPLKSLPLLDDNSSFSEQDDDEDSSLISFNSLVTKGPYSTAQTVEEEKDDEQDPQLNSQLETRSKTQQNILSIDSGSPEIIPFNSTAIIPTPSKLDINVVKELPKHLQREILKTAQHQRQILLGNTNPPSRRKRTLNPQNRENSLSNGFNVSNSEYSEYRPNVDFLSSFPTSFSYSPPSLSHLHTILEYLDNAKYLSEKSFHQYLDPFFNKCLQFHQLDIILCFYQFLSSHKNVEFYSRILNYLLLFQKQSIVPIYGCNLF